MIRIRDVELIIGMEVHVQLATRSKMFSAAPSPLAPWVGGGGSAAPRDEPAIEPEPNTLTDPVVLGLPGALPTLNREAIELAMRVGVALGCAIPKRTAWDRKSYFYPDLPKGYQLSQYDRPLCVGGVLEAPRLDDTGFPDLDAPPVVVRLVRAHLEEDAGKLLHEPPAGWALGPMRGSLVDWNRAGTPLLEIVTEPDMRSAGEAVVFARALRDLCRWVGASPGVMQQGHMRFEPNINCRLVLDDGREVRTPIVEIKNLNSFRALADAIEFEHREQPGRWAEDGREHAPGAKTTRGWDERRGRTVLQREKEEAEDYRYFPEPDLPVLKIDDAWRARVRASVPELPAARLARLVRELGLSVRDAAALMEERARSELFEAALAVAAGDGVESGDAARAVATLMLQAGARLANERGVCVERLGLSAEQWGMTAAMRARGELHAAGADRLAASLVGDGEGADAREVADRLGLLALRDDAALQAWCREAIEAHPEIAEQVRQGNAKGLGRIIGDVMKRSGGRADAARAREIALLLLSAPS